MFSAFTINKTMFTLPSLALAVCCAGLLAPTIAQANEQAAEAATPVASQALPDDIMRSTGKWGGKFELPDTAAGRAAAPVATSAPLQFKLAQPAWLGVLDTAGEVTAFVATSRVLSNFGVSGNSYQRPPRVNTPIPPSN